jgi:protein phosphatase
VGALLQEALGEADCAILALIDDNPNWRGMATTIVVGLRGRDVVYIANLGDSRAYRVRDGALRLFSTDHSVAAALVAMGALSEEDVHCHFLRNQITGVLGGARGEEPAYEVMAVRSGDRLLFCSDGLWDYVDSSEIARVVTDADDARRAVRALLDAAYRAGAPDNVAMIVMHVE